MVRRFRSGAMAAAAWIVTLPAQAQVASNKAASDSPTLEEIQITADRQGSYGADLVQAGSFREACQRGTGRLGGVGDESLVVVVFKWHVNFILTKKAACKERFYLRRHRNLLETPGQREPPPTTQGLKT